MTMTTSAFTCLRCGNCCRHPGEVRLDEGEAESIASALGMDAITFTSRYTRLREDRLGLSLMDGPDGSCIFLAISATRTLNSEPSPNSCQIQSAKPRQCREFPFSWQYENLTAICPASSSIHNS